MQQNDNWYKLRADKKLHDDFPPKEVKADASKEVNPSLRVATRSSGQRSTLPPMLDCSSFVKCTLRFQNSSRSIRTITYSQLAGACGGVCTVANSKVQPFASTLKVNSIKAWTGGDSSQGLVEILWNSPVLAVEKENAMINSIPTNMTAPCSVVAKPPKGTLASFYANSQVNASLALFSITAPIGSIIDISVSYALSNIYIAVPSITIATGTLGIIYYLPLDHGVADTYIPLGRTTTT